MTSERKAELQGEIFDLKNKKTKCKSAFTKTRNKLLMSISEDEAIEREVTKELIGVFEAVQDEALIVMERLSLAYKESEEMDNVKKVQSEIETLEIEFSKSCSLVHETLRVVRHPKKETKSEQKLGTDMWRQMKRVSIPVFNGNKQKYQSWKACFEACIDKAPATPEYKLLQLRQYLEGEALNTIDNLGHSAASYEAALDRLERKYGGTRRQIAIYLEELERFQPMKDENAKNIERFADLLDIAVINMKEAKHAEDLGNGSLYLSLQKKMPESMLTRYHRWVLECEEDENVETLRKWINLESKYHTIANETINGLMHDKGKPKKVAESYVGKSGRPYTYHVNDKNQKQQCKLCSGPHQLWFCQVFKTLQVQERWTKAKELHLCFRCLRDDHIGSGCRNTRKCGVDGCIKTHNRLLHETSVTQPKRMPMSYLNQQAQEFVPRHQGVARKEQVFTSNERGSCIALRTVPVIVSANGRKLKINALLDDVSTKTYLNKDVASELDIDNQTQNVSVNVMNGRTESFKTMLVTFELESMRGQKCQVEAFTTSNVTGSLRPMNWKERAKSWEHLTGIEFADLGNANKVDLLIGLDYSDLHRSLKEVHGKPGEPIARLTPLGWTCVGTVAESAEDSTYSTFFVNDLHNLERTLSNFWEIDTYDESQLAMSPLDRKVCKIVEQKMIKEDDFYTVPVPWKENKQELKNNYTMALDRLKSTEKRLQKDKDVSKIYSETVAQYVEKAYVEKLPEDCHDDENVWYLPHFAVVRLAKETTKVRIVFDASAKFKGISLNDAIYQGPKLQRELCDVLMRFRKYPVAIACDVAEMYLRVGLNGEDQSYHRFLWRQSPDETPEIYQFKRLVFGVNASPFLAQYVSQYNAEKYKDQFPLAAETVQKSTYMDDGLDSVQTVEKGIKLYHELRELWSKAGMRVRKWVSNSAEVLEQIPTEDRSQQIDLTRQELPSLKTLGVLWNAKEDCFSFHYSVPNQMMVITKRNFLKVIATVFDPLGLLAPFIMMAKILMQNVWISGVDWDDEVCAEAAGQIRDWFQDIDNLHCIKVPRCIQQVPDAEEASVTLHVFVDASTVAYGAVVYVRSSDAKGNHSVTMAAAKGRVAPLQAISIPRLELLAAVTGLRLTQMVCRALQLPIENAVVWSDSMNVLFWIRNHSRRLKPFVANRVSEIQSSTSPSQWRYVPSEMNPADIVSRGMTAIDLAAENLWWQGPGFLKDEIENWPENRVEKSSEAVAEVKKSQQADCYISLGPMAKTEERLDPERFSRWLHLVHVLAWVYRFLNNCSSSKQSGPLNPDEMRDSENKLISESQSEAFAIEIQALRKKEKLPEKSRIACLNPKLDQEGILRANGRLVNADFLPYAVRYLIVLPCKNRITFLIIRHFHELRNHSGTNDVLSALSAKYWIVHAREEIHRVERACMECQRRKAKVAKQIMAPLPDIRLNMPLRAFAHTSVDYGGPFITMQGRGKRREKRYLCLFTCLASRAVHLEMAFGLDTDSFLNALFRFINRRGVPVKMLSDRGTNFIGADKELKNLVKTLDTNQIVRKTANRSITWQFNPPAAPHWGGVHEIMIKAAKKAIYAILRGADVNDEELMTALSGAEALINSRPLTYQSSHPADLTPLTPNHFLTGQMGGEFAPQDDDYINYNPVRRWRRVQELTRHFWHRWLKEWLPALSSRKKWYSDNRDLQEDDIVLIMSTDAPRGQWPLARVIEVYRGRDQHVRAVKVRVGQNEYVRPISKLCPLEGVAKA